MAAESTHPGASPEPRVTVREAVLRLLRAFAQVVASGLAASQGCKAVRVQSAAALDDAVGGALAASEPTLVEVMVES